jgi:hypothetical protein
MNEPAVPARYHQAAQFRLNSGEAAAFYGTGWLWKTTYDYSIA